MTPQGYSDGLSAVLVAAWLEIMDMNKSQRRILRAARRVSPKSFRPGLEGMESRVLLSNFLVTTTSDVPVSNQLTLREAIEAANANPGPDTISFSFPAQNIPGVIDFDRTFQAWRIHVDSALPAI